MGQDDGQIHAFVEGYTAAIQRGMQGDAARPAAECYALPALVVRDRMALTYEEHDALAADLAALAQRYAAAGLTEAASTVTHSEPLTDVLTSVDVRFEFSDADGTTQRPEWYRYVIRATEDGPRIQVVTQRSGDPAA